MKRETGKGAAIGGGICDSARSDRQKSRESVIANLVVFVSFVGIIRIMPYILDAI